MQETCGKCVQCAKEPRDTKNLHKAHCHFNVNFYETCCRNVLKLIRGSLNNFLLTCFINVYIR